MNSRITLGMFAAAKRLSRWVRRLVARPHTKFTVAAVAVLLLILYGLHTDYFLYNPDTLSVMSAFSIPIVAAFGALIAYRQARTAAQQKQIAKTNLRLALFDRRLRIYDAASKFVRGVITSGVVNTHEKFKYGAIVQEAKWLLNDEIHGYLNDTLLGRVLDLEDIDTALRETHGGGDGAEKKELVERRREIRNWLEAQIKTLDTMFSPFLRFRIEK